MKVRKSGARVLLYESFGFGLILLLAWLNKFMDLPRLLMAGDVGLGKWRDGFIETLLILLIWAFVHSLTKRLVDRLHYLEGMLRICAWCRKVGHGQKWMRLEDYLSEGRHIGTTHGVCPDCLKKMQDATRQFFRSEALEKTTPLPPPQSAPETPSLAA